MLLNPETKSTYGKASRKVKWVNMNESSSAEALYPLLREAVRCFMSSAAHIVHVEESPIAPGRSSGPAVRRYRMDIEEEGRAAELSLVTKEAPLVERRVLARLNEQEQRSVPLSCTFDLTYDAPVLLCLQDLGDVYRPQRGAIMPQWLEKEARGLASIHVSNRQQGHELSWLPRVDHAYVVYRLLSRHWRPAWEQAVKQQAFLQAFGPQIPLVEAAADQVIQDLKALVEDSEAFTLIHTDLNPSNILYWDDRPFFIDWEAAHYGSLYFDVPHQFWPLDRAEVYRQALLSCGWEIAAADFAERYHIVARYIGLRYMPWALGRWQDNHQDTADMWYYLQMVLS
jgi:hypothetical protein